MELSNMNDRAKDCFMEAVLKRCEDIIKWPFLLEDSGPVDVKLLERQEARPEDLYGFGQVHHSYSYMKIKPGRREGGGRQYRAKRQNGPNQPQQQGELLEQVKNLKPWPKRAKA